MLDALAAVASRENAAARKAGWYQTNWRHLEVKSANSWRPKKSRATPVGDAVIRAVAAGHNTIGTASAAIKTSDKSTGLRLRHLTRLSVPLLSRAAGPTGSWVYSLTDAGRARLAQIEGREA